MITALTTSIALYLGCNLYRSCSRQMPLLSSVAVNVTSKGLTCFGCLNLQGGLSSTSIGCFDPLTGIPIAVISTVPAAGLFAMPAPDGYNCEFEALGSVCVDRSCCLCLLLAITDLFLPTIDGRSGSILFDPVSRNILKIISTIGFQGMCNQTKTLVVTLVPLPFLLQDCLTRWP